MQLKIPKRFTPLFATKSNFFWRMATCVFFANILFLSAPHAQSIAFLETQLSIGNHWAIRDAASILDQEKYEKPVRQLLQNYTFFDLKYDCDKTTFLNYFYKNEKNIHFSNLYKLFYINDLEKEKVSFVKQKIENSKYKSSLSDQKIILDNLLTIGDIEGATNLLHKISENHYGEETFAFLKVLSNDKRISTCSSSQRIEMYRGICDALGNYPQLDALETVLQLIESEKVPPALTAIPLARITNIFSANEGTDANMAKRYRTYLDSLKTLEAMQAFGYQRFESDLKSFFFDDPIDYYAALLHRINAKEGYWWLRTNLIRTMMATKNPRVLYYLAADMFRDRNQSDPFLKSGFADAEYIRYAIMNDIGVQDSVGKTQFNFRDFDHVAKRNYFIYWSANWNTYEWDDYKCHFVPKIIKEEEKERLDRLFRRLNASNDSIAINSYTTLCESNPIEVQRLSNKYRNLLRNFNPLLPDVKKMFLDQTALFTDLCREYQLNYQLGDEKKQLLQQLQLTTIPKERFLLEEKLLKIVNYNDISGLEYWSLCHTNNLNDNYTLSRIIQTIYRKYWNSILSNKDRVRIYFKKAILLNKIQTFGYCHQYLQFFEKSDLEKLKALFEYETDLDIKSEIDKLLISNVLNIDKNIKTEKEIISKPNLLGVLDKIKTLNSKDSITIDELNNIVKDKDFLPENRNQILMLLPKIRPFEDVVDLALNPKIDLGKEEKYLEKLVIPNLLLSRFVRIFNSDNPSSIFEWYKVRISKEPALDQGIFWNTMMRQRWFLNYVNSSNFKIEESKSILNVLNFYLQNAENISEFEEQQLLLNTTVLDNIGKDIKSQLETALALDIEENIKSDLLTEIVAHVNYSDIAVVVPELRKLTLRNGKSPISFLSEDFGIPVFDFDTAQDELAFTKKIVDMKPLNFYTEQLKNFGVDIWNSDKSLNYNKIDDILKHEVIAPYSGGGGTLRDWYVYTVVKILEFTHNTNLGFHEKMNENQTFYSYNVSKRAAAWSKFIDKKNLKK